MNQEQKQMKNSKIIFSSKEAQGELKKLNTIKEENELLTGRSEEEMRNSI